MNACSSTQKVYNNFILFSLSKHRRSVTINTECYKWKDLKIAVANYLDEDYDNVFIWKLSEDGYPFSLDENKNIHFVDEIDLKSEESSETDSNETDRKKKVLFTKTTESIFTKMESFKNDSNILPNEKLIYVIGLNNFVASLKPAMLDATCRCKSSGEQYLLVWACEYVFIDFWKYLNINHNNIEEVIEVVAGDDLEFDGDQALYCLCRWRDQKRLNEYINRFSKLSLVMTKYIFHDIVDGLEELAKHDIDFEWYDLFIGHDKVCRFVPDMSYSWEVNSKNEFVLMLMRALDNEYICSSFLYLFVEFIRCGRSDDFITNNDFDKEMLDTIVDLFLEFVKQFYKEIEYDTSSRRFNLLNEENDSLSSFLKFSIQYASVNGVDLTLLGVNTDGVWNTDKMSQLFGEDYIAHFVSLISYIFRECAKEEDISFKYNIFDVQSCFDYLMKRVINGKIELNDEKLKEIFTDYILPRQMLLFFVFIDFFNPTLQNIKSHPLMRLDGLVRLIDQKEERNLEGIFTYSRRGLPVDEVRNFVAHEMGMKPSNVLLFYNDRVLQSTEGRNENARISTTFIDYVEEINLDYLIVEEYDGFWVSRKSTGNEYGCKRTKSEKDKGVEMLRNLGKGAFATVNLCRIWPENKFCAMKKIKRAKEEDVMSFLREVNVMRCLKRVKHENVVQILDWFSRNNRLCLLLEYVDGGNMKSMLGDEGLCDNDIKKYGKQVTSGLCCLHANNIIHFDIKCLNILVSADRNLCKLTDFGLSRRLKRRDQKLTERNVTTTAWLQAPEIINNEPLTAKADIWSLGATIIEMATGRYPYHHLNSNQALVKIGMTRDLAYDKLNISESIKNIIAVCAKAKPEERKSAEELLNMSIFD